MNWATDSSAKGQLLKTGFVSGEMTSLERNKKINQNGIGKSVSGVLPETSFLGGKENEIHVAFIASS